MKTTQILGYDYVIVPFSTFYPIEKNKKQTRIVMHFIGDFFKSNP